MTNDTTVEDTTADLLSPPPASKASKAKASKASKAKASKASKAPKAAKGVETKPAKASKPKAKASKAEDETDAMLAAPAKGKGKAKVAAEGTGNRRAKGQGNYFMTAEDKDAMAKLIMKQLRNPKTTIELGQALEVPTWQPSVVARYLRDNGQVTLERVGNALQLTKAA